MSNELSSLKSYGTDLTQQQIDALQANNNVPQIRHVDKQSNVNGMEGFNLGRFYIWSPDRDKCIPIGKTGKGPDGKTQNTLLCMVGPFRITAMHLVNNQVQAMSHDPQSQTFQRIKQAVDGKVKKDGEGFMYGFEFLLWVPPEEINHPEYPNGFAGLYYFKNTSRQFAPTKFVNTPMVLITREIPKPYKGYTWYTPSGREVLTPEDSRVKSWYEKGVQQLLEAAPSMAAYKADSVREETPNVSDVI